MFIFTCFLFVHSKSSKIPLDAICGISSSTNCKCLSYIGTAGNLADESYVNFRKLPTSHFTYNISGYKSNYPATNLFDDDSRTYWFSDKPSTDKFHNSLDISLPDNYIVFDDVALDNYISSRALCPVSGGIILLHKSDIFITE